MTTLLVLAMVVILAGLLWSWWSGRLGRDPSATVDHFHRALSAMSPEERREAVDDSRGTENEVGGDTSDDRADGPGRD